MKITHRSIYWRDSGYALIVTMSFMAVMLVLFGTMMYYTMTNAKITKDNNQYNASQAAAEAATEKVLSQMTHDFENESLTNDNDWYADNFLPTAAQTASWPIQYVYSGTNGSGTNNQISVVFGAWSTNYVPLNSQYTGLYGEEQDCTITATATPTTGVRVPATVVETIQFALIPLFQFAIFYNMNLEIAAAQTLGVEGAVYSNGGLWSGSDTITFYSTVSAVGLATNAVEDPFCAGYSGSGKSTYSMAEQPTSDNDTITMPVGSNNNPASVEAIVNIPPTNYMLGTSTAYSTNGQLYLANEADLYVTNYPNGTNWGWTGSMPLGHPMAVYYNDSANAPNYLTWVTNDFYYFSNYYSGSSHLYATNYLYLVTNYNYTAFFQQLTNNVTAIKWTNNPTGTNYLLYAGYSFLTNVIFYDWREGWHNGSGPPKTVQAVQLDLVALNKWMTNNAASNGGSYFNTECSSHKTHPIDSMYIYNAVPLTTTTLPAVRVVNGGRMPENMSTKGFTLATAMPVYVWGDYNVSNSSGSSISQNNTVYTAPAAFMCDAVTILSDKWQDTNSVAADKSTDAKGGPTASTTTVNAAILAGIDESNTNNPASEGTSDGYSGGVENFLRTLENWSSSSLYYNGSIIVMFPCQYATNCWQQTDYYYEAPDRHWAFDTNFFIGSELPPLTPQSQGVIRGTWDVN